MRRIAFLLLDEHPLLSIASALEPLRAANQFSEEVRYDITLLSGSGTQAVSSLESHFQARFYRDVIPLYDLLFVVAGGDPMRPSDPALFNWLRLAERNGVALGGISGGAVLLARAGLLDDRRFTVHWHHYDDFEKLPAPPRGEWQLERRLFVIDRDRYTCAGGAAPLDMMHAIIARDHGMRFAKRISEWFIQTEIRGPDAPQLSSAARRYGALPRGVEAALELMESHISDPLNQDQIASLSGLSIRQLQRKFRAEIGHSVMEEYRRIRLETGRELIETTRLPLSEIAQMTGFATQTHFSDSFRRIFGMPPSALRKATSSQRARSIHATGH